MTREILITCVTCDGEKTVERDKPGGFYNTYLGGWEPDTIIIECPECDGTGSTWVEVDDEDDEEDAA